MRGGAGSSSAPESKEQPGRCSSCAYWKHTPDDAHSVASAIKGAPLIIVQSGDCYYAPPGTMMMMVMEENAITRQMVPRQVPTRTFPKMLENEFCAQHPERVMDRLVKLEYALEVARRRAAAETVEYDPNKHGDANAGFNRAPTFGIAKRMSNVADGEKFTGPGGGDVQPAQQAPQATPP